MKLKNGKIELFKIIGLVVSIISVILFLIALIDRVGAVEMKQIQVEDKVLEYKSNQDLKYEHISDQLEELKKGQDKLIELHIGK